MHSTANQLYIYVLFIQHSFLQTCLQFVKKKNQKYNWLNTRFVTKVFCKISRLSDLNDLQKFVGFFVFSSWGKGGIPNASRKNIRKKNYAQLIYLYNFNKVPGPAYLKHVAEFLSIFLEAEPAFGTAGAGTQSVRVVEDTI